MNTWEDSLHSSGQLQRLPATPELSGWGGDPAEVYSVIDTLSAIWEVTDIDTLTVFAQCDTAPVVGDRIDLEDAGVLDVLRVRPWTNLDGELDHYEMTCREVRTQQRMTTSG